MHFGAHGLQVQDFLGGHFVRHHQHHAITFGAPNQCQAQAGVASGGFDDGAAGLQTTITLGSVDHGQTDTVLDRTTGVLRFEFEKQCARASIETSDLNQRSVAYQPKYGRA